MQLQFDDPFYYLSNFHKALNWLRQRHADLLLADELAFLCGFGELAQPAQALLVRMIMRKGRHFRASKLDYAEIGCTRTAAQALLAKGLISDEQALTPQEVFGLLRKDELLEHFDAHALRRLKKAELLEHLSAQHPEPRRFADWCPNLDERVYSLSIHALCERLRLMFFGNLRQDWSEFVLADLGIFRYEQVELSADSRVFRHRGDVDCYLQLQDCRDAFEAGEPLREVLQRIDAQPCDTPFLAARRDKLLFRLGQHLEREAQLDSALACYADCRYAEARLRRIRVLERLARPEQAYALACEAAAAPHNDAESQGVKRALQRLGRQLGLDKPAPAKVPAPSRIDLCLPKPEAQNRPLKSVGEAGKTRQKQARKRLGSHSTLRAVNEHSEPVFNAVLPTQVVFQRPVSVEYAVKLHLSEPEAPVHYVENSLICSLFGLLCWPAIFAPLPGAFFHPFHSGPVDLLSADFHPRRAALFAACLTQLDSDAYKSTIRQTYTDKYGILSPFVFWGALDAELLEQALDCLPAAHLRAWFQRLLLDIKANRAGMPDLIQFWPAHKRYRMIEVKGPGDRLQDNQRRWLAFCAEHGMPVDVCYVQWAEA